jgi:hypothetical protein
MNVYHIPGAVFKAVPQVATASEVAPTVVPVMVCPQLMVIAPVQRLFGWLNAAYPVSNSEASTKKYSFFINRVWLLNKGIIPWGTFGY